jgi:hypothetical protein
MKLTKEEFAKLQAAKDLLVERGVMNTTQAHAIQNKLDNLLSGNGRGQWGKRFKDNPKEWRRELRK